MVFKKGVCVCVCGGGGGGGGGGVLYVAKFLLTVRNIDFLDIHMFDDTHPKSVV